MAYTIDWQAGTDDHCIEVDLVATTAQALEPHSPEAIASPIVDLVNLAARGGLSGSQRPPQDARARVVSHTVQPPRVQWRLEVEGLTPNLLANVEGALNFFDAEIAALDRVSITAPPTMLAARANPPESHFSPLPFSFVDDREEYQSLQIEIRFPEAVSAETAERVEVEAFGMWVCAASMGTFCDETKVYLGENRYADDYIVLELEELILPEPDAIDSLINTLSWAHHHIQPISSVELYD